MRGTNLQWIPQGATIAVSMISGMTDENTDETIHAMIAVMTTTEVTVVVEATKLGNSIATISTHHHSSVDVASGELPMRLKIAALESRFLGITT